jgi:DNA-binding Lrp family transcriptional regulator
MNKRNAMHRFYFIKPKPNSNADEVAEKLISLKQVESVFLTEGDCGFIVKARITKDKEPKGILKYILGNVGNRYGRVVSYCEYRKTA